MAKVSKYGFVFALVSCLLLAQPLFAEEGIKGNLVTVQWLQKNLKNPDVVILDASPVSTYTVKHVPGAVSVNVLSWYGLQEIPLPEMEKIYQSWGVSAGKKIVMYDQGGSMNATLLLYKLYHHGFPQKDLLLVDGGLFKWEQESLPLAKEPSLAKKGSFKITKVKEEVRVMLPEMVAASGDPKKNALLEALTPNWHFGEFAPFGRPGHIPNGIMVPSPDFYNADKTFKSPEELKKMMAYLGVRPDQTVYSYCGGGVAASVPFFALKFILDYPNVKLHKESLLGWLQDERRLPNWTYDAPFLMRDAAWVQSWGGQMLRMYGGGQVSIVDVRSAGAFNQGHVPFALNVSADIFKSNLASPAKLAETLGPAGVDVSHEAVVVSGAGITKDAALAFVMLERLGQKKVSILTDSMEKWTKAGFAVKTDPTVVGPKKNPQDVAVLPTTYPANFRKDVMIADAQGPQGPYPKVFIASGKEVPEKSQEGKVIHVPYTDLLNDDGTPKAAKDIWNILAKAGVPRYAELICISDDPGEAAVNYYILKLMGFPDAKVLAS